MLVQVIASSAVSMPVAQSVHCAGGGSCKLGPFAARPWSARASFEASTLNSTGWMHLTVESNAGVPDNVAAFAAGYIEGIMTREVIDLEWLNLNVHPSSAALGFVKANNAWVRGQIKTETSQYWRSVSAVYAQFDGIVAGYRASGGMLSSLQLQLINMQVELDDIEKAVQKQVRPDFLNMTGAQFDEYVFTHSHCSAMIKVTADLGELYAAHNTWFTYSDMGLRIWKVYHLPLSHANATTVSFPGYPGRIAGIDDFYVTSQELVVIETTNGIYNNSLYDRVTPEGTVPYWVRVTAANRLATSGTAWHKTFYVHNSGTYNNQWMVTDYKLYVPGEPLKPNTLWVSEQIPGFHVAADQTSVLQRGHWPSYNVPFYDEIYARSGYPAVVEKMGPHASYQLARRAPIFRQYADGMVTDLASMRRFMRLNRWSREHPSTLFPSPDAAIAARGDLASGPISKRPGGAYDAKIASHAMVKDGLSATAIAGPTADDQPCFSWTGEWATQTSYPHYGHPTVFNFSWLEMRGVVA